MALVPGASGCIVSEGRLAGMGEGEGSSCPSPVLTSSAVAAAGYSAGVTSNSAIMPRATCGTPSGSSMKQTSV